MLFRSSKDLKIDIEDSYSEVGGGSLPLVKLPTKVIAINSALFSTQKMEVFLRKSKVSIISRVYKDKLYLDLRTIRKDEYSIIVDAIENMCQTLKERI